MPQIFDRSVQMYIKAYSMKMSNIQLYTSSLVIIYIKVSRQERGKKCYQGPARWENIEA